MAVFYNVGENKKRPGVYQRHTNTSYPLPTGAQDGVCAIPVRASWGPLGVVLKNTLISELTDNYGAGTYGADYTVPAAVAMFEGGAATVYTYRLGTGGEKASKEITTGLTATAKYPGTMPITVAVQEKLGDSTKKQLVVYAGTALVESWDFTADGANEGANLIAAAKDSKYLDITGTATTVPVLAAASGSLTGGTNPTVANNDYSAAFAALEHVYYNTIALDVDDDENVTLALLLQAYKESAYKLGKLGIAVVGEKASVNFVTRLSHAKAFNDAKVVFLGGGWKVGNENRDGALAICYTAGVIASTPANQGITHTIIKDATDLCENLTYAEYEAAIDAGMLMVSMSPDGNVWYDTGITSLTSPETSTQDDGWKKIRRVKVRFEMMDRLDRALAPKVGKVSANSNGISDIIQTGQRVMNSMVSEGKLAAGALFVEDPAQPYSGDSAWFIIQADDIDSLEKIYLHYQFRYSQNS